MNPADISCYVLSFNEKENIARCLEAVSWIPRVCVVDSVSNDGTQEVASGFPNVTIVERPFVSLREQHSFALELQSESQWVLRLDSDWIVTDELKQKILELDPPEAVSGYRIRFRFVVNGRDVPIAAYPPVVCLFRPERCEYIQDGHTERIVVRGLVRSIDADMLHDDRKPIDRFMLSQIRYSRDEVDKIRTRARNVDLSSSRDRLVWLKYRLQRWPGLSIFGVFVFLAVIKGGLFRGREARHYVLQRVFAEATISLRVSAADLGE